MSHQPRLSKALQRAQAGKLKRKNSLSVHQGQLEFQLSLEQAQSIQARLPGDIWLINTNPEQFQKTKEQIRLACIKSMESQQRRPELTHDHDSQKGPAEIPKKKGHAGPRKTHPEEPSLLAQSQPQHEERTPKEVIHKRKGPKYNNNAQLEYQVPLLKKQEKNRSEQQIAWMKPNEEALEMMPYPQVQAVQETFGTMAYPSSSAIPSLPSGLPRYIEPSQQQLEGTAQINNLRCIFGLRHRQPSEHGFARLNEKQKSFCSNICQRLKSHRSSQPFRVAVDPETQRVPDYYYVIYNPMDLQTIQKKITKDKYCEISEFHADINQIILNSYKYNLRETVYFSATVEFEDYYHELLRQALQNPEEFIRDHVPKVSKKKPIPNSGERDFIEKTPLKEKKRVRGRRLNLNLSQRLKSRKEEQSLRDQSQEGSAMNEESIVEPSVTTRNLDKTVLRNISLMRAQSMPLESEAAEIFEPSFEHMNTQSNNTNPLPKHRKRSRKPREQKEKEKSTKPRHKNSGIYKDKSRRGEPKADSIHNDNQKMQEIVEEIQKDNQHQHKANTNQLGAMDAFPQVPEREPSVASQQKSKLSREEQQQKNMLQDDYNDDDEMFDIYFGNGNQEEEPANKMKEERDEQPDLGPLAMEDIIMANPYEPIKQAQPMDQEVPKEQAPKQEAMEMKPEQKPSPSQKGPKKKKQASSKQITMYISKAANQKPNPMEQEKKTSQKYFTSVNFDGEEQSITVNNLNTHPQSHPELIELSKEQQKEIEKKGNEEMYVEVSIPAKPAPDKKPKGKGKGKRKHVDDAYVASSGDEEYVVNTSRYSKKNKNRIRKKDADRESNSNGSTKKRRGRRSNRQIEAARRQAEVGTTVPVEGQQEVKKQELEKPDSKQSREQVRQLGDIFMEPESEKKDPGHLVEFNFDDI